MKLIFLFSVLLLFPSCGKLTYLWNVSVGQLNLYFKRIPIKKALESKSLSPEDRAKLELVQEIKDYAINELDMDIDRDIYSTFVELDDPHVTYLLRVSLAYELKAYEWTFPVTGSVPYKGFFKKENAIKEAKSFSPEKYDVYMRGVTAYSTLGWFEDSILSSMLRYNETDFTTMIFHELAHTVLFFKGHINFNERFAEFIGRKAALSFYKSREGENSPKVQQMEQGWKDELIFSSFMVSEYESLNKWYKDNKGKISPEQKKQRIRDIQDRFLQNIRFQLSSNRYDYFPQLELNNAKLLSYRSYNFKMDEMEQVFNSPQVNQNIGAFIEFFSQFKSKKDPEKALSLYLEQHKYTSLKGGIYSLSFFEGRYSSEALFSHPYL